jgi:hypothetical protein
MRLFQQPISASYASVLRAMVCKHGIDTARGTARRGGSGQHRLTTSRMLTVSSTHPSVTGHLSVKHLLLLWSLLALAKLLDYLNQSQILGQSKATLSVQLIC